MACFLLFRLLQSHVTVHVTKSSQCVFVFLQCSSESNTCARVNITAKEISFQYSVKVMNPQRKTSFFVHKLSHHGKFDSQEHMKDELSTELGSPVEGVGYVSPGHVFEGKA